MPPIGGRNTERSGRVTSSGYMPPVCSNKVRRSLSSVTPKRAAMPGRYQTGSIAALVTATSPRLVHDLAVDLESALVEERSQFRQRQPRLGDRDGRADVDALARSPVLKSSATRWPHGSSETMRVGLGPLRERADLDDRRRVVQVRPRDRIERAGGNRERAIERIGAAMRADRVAVGAGIDGADHGAAFARSRRAPADRETARASRCPGCDVSRIWPSLFVDMTLPHKSKKPSPAAPGEWLQRQIMTKGCDSGKGGVWAVSASSGGRTEPANPG